MHSSLCSSELLKYIEKLVQLYLPDNKPLDLHPSFIDQALNRIEYCHSHIKLKYFQEDSRPIFNHLHGDHMAAFLWFLSNALYIDNPENLTAFKLSYLNKIMHGLDLFCTVSMPDIFLLVHPVGTVIGNAFYSDFLVIYQGCTIGSKGANYPKLGMHNIFYANSSLIGSSSTDRNVVFGANTSIINTQIKSDSLVVGSFPSHRVLHRPVLQTQHIFV